MKALRMLKWIILPVLVICSSVALANTSDTTLRDSKPPIKTVIIDPGHGGKDGGARGRYYTESQLALAISLKVQEVLKKEMAELNVLMTRTTDVLPGNQQDINAALRWRANFANQNAGDLFISIHLNATAANQKYGKRVVGEKEQTYYTYTGKGKSRKKIKKTRTVPVYERYKLPATVHGTQTYILAKDWYQGKVSAANQQVKQEQEHVGGEADSLTAEMLDLDPIEAKIRAAQYTKLYFTKSMSLAEMVEDEFAGIGRKSWGVLQRDWAGIWVLQATQMPCILIESGFVDNPEEEDFLASAAGQELMAQAVVKAIKRYMSAIDGSSKITAAN